MTYLAYLEYPGGYRRAPHCARQDPELCRLAAEKWRDKLKRRPWAESEHSVCLTIRRACDGPPHVEDRLEHPYASLRFECVKRGTKEKYTKYAGNSRREYLRVRSGAEIARVRAGG